MTDKNFGVIILAAGKGTRMKSDKLKVMHTIKDKPMIGYILDEVEKNDWSKKPVVIVCDDDDSVQKFLGNRAVYAVQRERLGTGHAVMMAEDFLENKVGNILVLYGDMPFIGAEFIKNFTNTHLQQDNTLTLATVKVPSFKDGFQSFYSFGRIVRNADGQLQKIVEKKDATPEELEIKELNTAVFCFKADWLWVHLKQIKNANSQGEFYLTDLIEFAFKEKQKISTVEIDTDGSFGINTQEDLTEAEDKI